MFTIDDLSDNLVNNSSLIFINIILSFLNNFYNTYKVLDKEEILNRINRLEYIGYEDKTKGYYCNTDKACFGSGFYYYIALNKNVNDKNLIKAYLYHELIHCISLHYENNNLVSGYNNETSTNIFDEIITEYYTHKLLINENININNKFIYNKNNNYELYSEYNACGYHEYMGLGEMYYSLFLDTLLEGKLISNDLFINEFNNIVSTNNLDLTYEDFITNKDPNKRYIDITILFINYLINCYRDDYCKEEIIKDYSIYDFLSKAPKEKVDNNIVPCRLLESIIYDNINNFLSSQKKVLII